ncbi:MAG: hypothetical protein HRU01_17180 [Myxococcales bacterium]|nr:hypothetical protein [Myxococcales bacterium]
MAIRPLAFGARFKDNGRTVRVNAKQGNSMGYEVTVERRGKKTRRSEHSDLTAALSKFASAWRGRLN